MKTQYWARMTLVLVSAGLASAPALAQEPAAAGTRAAIEAEFSQSLIKIETVKIKSLGELAASQKGAEATQTYDDLFRFAIGANLYEAAEPIAAKVLASDETQAETALLAQLVSVIAKANRGDYEGSLASLTKALNEGRDVSKAANKSKTALALPLNARVALLNQYVQRLIHSGRYDVAQRALQLVRDGSTERAIKELAASRLLQLQLVGKPAPPLVGTDLDGKAVKLSDHDGKVVLVLFWASWYPLSSGEAQKLNALVKTYGEKGFRIIGVNLDTKQEGATPASVLPAVRRFLIENNIAWPNVLNETGAKDYAAAFGVTQIPADVLIGRDGKVIHLDLDPASLEKVLSTLMGK